MGDEAVASPRCPETQLAVPECSCKRCLEAMLYRFSPELLAGEMKVTRLSAREEPPERREAA